MFLILYIPTVCALHETQCSSYHTALYISFRLSARRTKFSVLYHIFRLYARCMKLSVRHIILRFTFHSGCPRVVRNSVFLIPYIPFVRVLHETPCFSYYIFRLYARCMKLSVRHIILRFTFHSGCPRVVRNSVFLIPYIPFVRVLHETPCFSYYIFRLYARCMKLSVRHIILRFTFHSGCPRVVRNSVFLIPYIPFVRVLHETPCFSYYIFRLYARCMKLSVRHIILRFTFHSDCPRVVRNSVSYTIYSDCMRVA